MKVKFYCLSSGHVFRYNGKKWMKKFGWKDEDMNVFSHVGKNACSAKVEEHEEVEEIDVDLDEIVEFCKEDQYVEDKV